MRNVRFPEDTSDDVLKRLRRVEGQVRGLQRLVDEGAECHDIVTQLRAAKGALDGVGFTLVSSALRQCALEGGDTDELEKLFLKLG